MYALSLDQLKQKIVTESSLSAEDLESKIKAKIDELSGLISEEGAAHIVANELGLELGQEQATGEGLKIKDILAGMRDVSVAGKVTRIFDTRVFSKGDKEGKVCSIVVGDETGTIRVVFWNDQVDKVSSFKQDDVILVKSAYVRENRNQKELHMGDRADIEVNPQGVIIAAVKQGADYTRKKISDLQGDEQAIEIMGTVVQVFDPRYFHICPECNKRAQEVDGAYTCAEHGAVTPNLSYVLNAVVDDGTGTMRGVFWKQQTNHFLAKPEEEVASYKEDLSQFESAKEALFGEQYKLKGRVKRNDFFNRLEFVVQIVERASPQEELVALGE